MGFINSNYQDSVSPQRRLPVSGSASSLATAITGQAVQFYFVSGGKKTIDAGEAKGTEIFAHLGYGNIKNAVGDMVGSKLDTSIVLTTGTALVAEKVMDYQKLERVADASLEDRVLEMTKGLVAGEYMVDYVSGAIYAKKGDASVSDTASFTIEAAASGGTTGTQDTFETNPLSSQFDNSIVDTDTTNVTAATHYYPSSTGGTMDYYKDHAISGKLIDADGTLTLTLEVSNDEDEASADWNTVQMFDDNGGALVSSVTVTNGTKLFSLSMNNMNYRRFRYVLVASGATNTIVLKARAMAL